jgi:hypothetical protein
MSQHAQKFVHRRLKDGVFFVVFMALFCGCALMFHINPLHSSSPNLADGRAAFILQAQAWLHGHLNISIKMHDAIVLNGKVYIVFPPLPALLMAPFIALLGDKFSDIWFTWIFAALNIILLFRTLETLRVRRITSRTPLENLIIALTFGFGTIALWLSLGGAVWFTAQIISTFGIMITLHSTFSKRWSLATLGVGIVLLTRTSEVLIGIVPLVAYLRDLGMGRRVQQQWHFLPRYRPSLRELTLALVPFAVALLILVVRNKLYFNGFLSTGYDIQQRQDYPAVQYGLISWHYIWPNFVVDLLNLPSFSFANLFDTKPHLDLLSHGMGTSIFFSTPLLAIFLFAPQGKTASPWLRYTLWITAALLLLPVLLYSYEGWVQVGARYLLPLYPLLFLLLALRAAPLDTRWIGLAGLSVFINLLLAHAFWAGEPGRLFAIGAAGVVLLACAGAIIALRRQRQYPEKLAPATIPTEPAGNDESTEKLSAVR